MNTSCYSLLFRVPTISRNSSILSNTLLSSVMEKRLSSISKRAARSNISLTSSSTLKNSKAAASTYPFSLSVVASSRHHHLGGNFSTCTFWRVPMLLRCPSVVVKDQQRFDFSTVVSTNNNNVSSSSSSSEPYRPPGWELLQSQPKPEEWIRGALVGVVVSDKMQKTVNVAVDRFKFNHKYNRRIRFTRKFMAHDEEELCNVGDLVKIVPDRRRSRHKHFRVYEIIRAKGIL
jgi:small subunit ribosomal protein S17